MSIKTKTKKRTMTNEELETRLHQFQKSSGKAELLDLVHELEVLQIELEVQNRELRDSQNLLEESHEKYLNLYDFAPVAYVTLDKLGTILDLNFAAAELFGLERQRMIGRSLSSRICKTDQVKFRDHILLCRDGEKKTSEIIQILIPDQSIKHIQFSTIGRRARESGILTFRTAITDLTDQMQAERERLELLNRIEASRSQLYGFFMQAPSPMVIFEGRDHRHVLANPPYEKMIGRPALDKTIRDLFSQDELRFFVSQLDEVYKTGKPYVGQELPLELPDESGSITRRWINVAYYPDRAENGRITGVMAVYHDISESILTRQQLENATNMKSAFLANMSHEIRTPLGAILGFTDIIKRSDDAAEREKYGSIVARNGEALLKIINDILDLSKVEAGKLELEHIEFDIRSLIFEITNLFEDAALKKNLKLNVDIDPSMPDLVTSDPTRIRQILINLIGNALKFTKKGSVSVFAEPNFFGKSVIGMSFTIKDTGIGMSFEQTEKVFAPFSQADNSMTRKFGGSGLGLALSRRLARALGGDVLVQAKVGQGATFIATVEARRAVKRMQKVEFAKSDKTLKVENVSRVLLVEDSADNQLLVKAFLTQAGISVDIANNGAEGVEMAEANDYDVVIMDMQMPVLDGYAATEQLRSDGYSKPIVALTAHGMVEDRTRSLALGCNAHLTKPLDPRLLIETLNRV